MLDTNVCSAMDQQQAAALALANAVRTANARTLREIRQAAGRGGCEKVIAILEGNVKGPIGSLPVRRLLVAPRGMGDIKAAWLLRAAGVLTGDRPLRRLTARQRQVLAEGMALYLRRSRVASC